MLGVATISSGCGKQVSSEKSNVVDMLESDDSEVKDTFPDTYNAESESGKVKFNCTLELPENMNTRTIQKTTIEGVHSYDKDKAYSLLAEGKEISNKEQYDGDNGEIISYTFSDGASLYLDYNITWTSATSSLYAYLGVQQSDYIDLFSSDSVSLDKDKYISEMKKDMNELGYDTENLSFQAIPLSVDAMKKLRDQELNNGLLEKGKTNEPTSEDSPDNAPVQAIYSARGLESLTIDYIYNFKNEQNTVTLKPFDEIASVVEEKYDNILNDVNYEVTRAKLYERVYTGEDQKYAEEPIWYFEVMENGSNKTVMLVNAETGKEINLPS